MRSIEIAALIFFVALMLLSLWPRHWIGRQLSRVRSHRTSPSAGRRRPGH